MPADDEGRQRLHTALARIAEQDAGALLAEARTAARDHVSSLLRDALSQALLEQVTAGIEAAREPETEARPAVRERPPSEVRQEPPGEAAWYVYGIVGADATELPRGMAGVQPESVVDLLVEGPVAAVTTRVPLDEFEEEALRTHLNDLGWVERTARHHEEVLDSFCSRATVIPMRMCTVYRTEGGVREMLVREADALVRALGDLAGKSEWGVKVFARPVPAGAWPDEAPEEAGPAPAGEGTSYLARRRREQDFAARAERRVAEAAGEIHECLMTLCAEGRATAPQHAETDASGGELVLSGVYLVDRDAVEAFHREVDILEDRFAPVGIELVQTGPWPPYNFLPGAIGAAW
jgi:hypothetical protein